MEVAPRNTLLTLLTLFTLFVALFILFNLLYTAQTLACMPIYIVREGWNAIGKGLMSFWAKRGVDGGVMGDTL